MPDGLGDVALAGAAGSGDQYRDILVDEAPGELAPENIASLTATALNVQRSLNRDGITGADGEAIDHIEFFAPARSSDANSRNFVLCPGGEYDRSPCGTGTSAKIACLAAKGELKPGETWVQESIIGSRFEASYRLDDEGQVIPSIVGRAYICAETTLIQQADDPFVHGIK